MKAIRVNTPGNLEIVDLPMPKIVNQDDVLVKIKMAGICGSDMHIYHGTSPVATYPRVIGHEMAGEVVEAGPSADKFAAGDHVVIDPVISCGKCYPCSIGRPNVCFSLKVRGVHQDGGYQEYVVVPVDAVHKVSKEMPWERAVLVEPYTISAQIVSRGSVVKTDTVFIMGAGPIGLCVLQAVKRIGARCIVSDLVESRLALAKKLGADLVINAKEQDTTEVIKKETGGFGPTVVIDAVCSVKSPELAIDLVCNAGRVVLLGFNGTPSAIAQLKIVSKELDVRGTRLNARRFPEVISWFENNEVDTSCMVTGIYPFAQVKEAFKWVEEKPQETLKVLLKFE